MEIWQYIEVLRRPNKSWFFSNDNLDEKLSALTKIAHEGYPSLIFSLTDFLKDNNKEIQQATCDTIIHLFKKIDSKKVYYDTLKHCNISKSDIDFYEINFSKDKYTELLAISSLNGSGYVREKAVNKLSQIGEPRAIQYLIYRLADWVLPVRQAALKGLKNYKSKEFIDSLIENLPIFEWLQKVERTDLNRVYSDIIDFITKINRGYVLKNFKSYPDKLRLAIAKHISSSLTDYSQEIGLFISDKHFLIRNLAIDHFEKLTAKDIEPLLNDKSAKVRLQTLYQLKSENDFEKLVWNYVSDSSATIRHFARFTLKGKVANFGEVYNQNLTENKQVIGSLAGLAEVDTKEFSQTVMIFLKKEKIKIRKAAFLALRKLDKAAAYQFALDNLDSQFTGIRNVVIDFLSVIPRNEVLEKARDCYKTANYDIKKSMLKLFNKIGGWTTIPDLMIGTIDNNQNLRQLSFGYLQIWKTRAVRLFTTQKPGEIERAKQIFQFTHEIHVQKNYFKINPLDGLDFYFK